MAVLIKHAHAFLQCKHNRPSRNDFFNVSEGIQNQDGMANASFPDSVQNPESCKYLNSLLLIVY